MPLAGSKVRLLRNGMQSDEEDVLIYHEPWCVVARIRMMQFSYPPNLQFLILYPDDNSALSW